MDDIKVLSDEELEKVIGGVDSICEDKKITSENDACKPILSLIQDTVETPETKVGLINKTPRR